MRWNNWFYTGSTSFLQSQVQDIDLQTTISGGVGRYLKNTNRQSITLFGGIGWQNARYGEESGVSQESQNTAVAFVASQIKIFKFKKTNLDFTASLVPAISEPGRIHYNTNAVYYLKIIGDLSWNTSFYGEAGTPARREKSPPRATTVPVPGLSWTFVQQITVSTNPGAPELCPEPVEWVSILRPGFQTPTLFFRLMTKPTPTTP